MKNKRNQYLVNKKNGVVLKVKQYESNKKEEEKIIEMKKSLKIFKNRIKVVLKGIKKNNVTRPIVHKLTATDFSRQYGWRPLLLSPNGRPNDIYKLSKIKRDWDQKKSREMTTNGPIVSNKKVVIYKLFRYFTMK